MEGGLPSLRSVLAVSTILSVLAVASYMTAFAQEDQVPEGRGQALEISPTLVTLEVDPGETTTIQMQLRNVSDEDLVVNGQLNDFVASGETGAPRILLDEEESQDNPYSFREWVEPLPELLLEPDAIETLTATINVPEDASPGGYYGIVRFTGTPPELEGTGVSLSTSIGTLALLTVSGDIEENIEVEEFVITKNDQAGTLFESTPLLLVERIKNTGNVHVQTTGRVTIRDMFDREIAAANVNLARRNILPGSIRRFEQAVDSSLIGNKWLFGRYTAHLEMNYDEDKVVSDTITFWVIPYRLIAVIIVLILIAFLTVFFLLKRYKRRILAQAQGDAKKKS